MTKFYFIKLDIFSKIICFYIENIEKYDLQQNVMQMLNMKNERHWYFAFFV